jgi:murein DD-endopeptidase MepM/ murein hydrolase activator NlpD
MSRPRPVLPAAALFLVVAAVFAALSAWSPPASAADLQSKLEDKEAKLSHVRERKGVLTTTISRYKERIDRLTGEVAGLRTEEAGVRARLDAKQAQLDAAEAELDTAGDHLRIVRARLGRALTALRGRLVAMYENGSPDLVSVVLASDDYDELVSRTAYLEQIEESDEVVIGRVRELRDEVQGTVERLRAAKDTIESARDVIAAEEQALASARQAIQSRQSELVATRGERVAALEKIDATEGNLDGDVAEIQAELAAQLAGFGSSPLPAGPIRGSSSGSGLIWPVDGPVVSGFEMRWGRMHTGVDIAVSEGTPIRAAAAGTVVLLQSEAESGGYGNFTCLDHGGGLSTCYAHQSAIGVSSGQSVEQGQVIGYTGCTGHCFGPHLHFEVRINGEPTDPMGYL